MQFDRICPICLKRYNPILQRHRCEPREWERGNEESQIDEWEDYNDDEKINHEEE